MDIGPLGWPEEYKLVNNKYLKAAGHIDYFEANGYENRWVPPEKVEYYKIKGWNPFYEEDNVKQVKLLLVTENVQGQYDHLMFKPKGD